MSDAILIRVEGLTKSYRGNIRRALDGVSFTVDEGECFGLIGPNGAGKTTLMSCLLALIKADKGKVTIAGIPPSDLAVREVSGFLPERPNFENWLTGYEFMTMHHMLAKRSPSKRRIEIEEALVLTGLEASCWKRKIETYSRGMLQRLGLAQAMMGKPAILFLDEPGSGMDPPGNTLLRQLFTRFKSDGITVVLNSHHLDEMERVCDRVAFMKDGTIRSIEKLEKGTDTKHVLMVRWHNQDDAAAVRPVDDQKLAELARPHQCTLIELGHDFARFNVANTLVAAKLIKDIVDAGIPVCAVLPEYRTLERLFHEATSTSTGGVAGDQ